MGIEKKHSDLLLEFLKTINVHLTNIDELNGINIHRDKLLNEKLYSTAKDFIPKFKKTWSSSYLTCLHSNAENKQKWPLINILRQILRLYNFEMNPKRLANGYTKTGQKLYKRIFVVTKAIG